MWGRSWVLIEWGLGRFPQFFHIVGDAGLRRETGGWGVVTYQTPRHQVLGPNHNTANYLLLTRKNEHGPYMKK